MLKALGYKAKHQWQKERFTHSGTPKKVQAEYIYFHYNDGAHVVPRAPYSQVF